MMHLRCIYIVSKMHLFIYLDLSFDLLIKILIFWSNFWSFNRTFYLVIYLLICWSYIWSVDYTFDPLICWFNCRGVYSSPDSYILPCLVCRWNYVYFVILGGLNNYGTLLLHICFIIFQKFPKIPHTKSHDLPNLSYFPDILPGFIKSCPWFRRYLSAK